MKDETHLHLNRRTRKLVKKGFPGRKRGQGVRLRWVLQQAHTSEWLGTFGDQLVNHAGPALEKVCEAVMAYLKAKQLQPWQALVRVDGEAGHASEMSVLAEHEFSFITRVVTYKLLSHKQLEDVLEKQTPTPFRHAETGTERELFDAGFVDWHTKNKTKTMRVRIIIAKQKVTDGRKHRVGVRRGDFVYELFGTNVCGEALTATDVVSLYFGRGAAEKSLLEEDQELELDRWVSGEPWGQELWQIIGQWVWNLRLQMGERLSDFGVRKTRWSDDETRRTDTENEVKIELSDAFEVGIMTASPIDEHQVSQVASRPEPPQLHSGFRIQTDGTLRCPNVKSMTPLTRIQSRCGEVIRYQAKLTDCMSCPLRKGCWKGGPHATHGRRLNVLNSVVKAVCRRASTLGTSSVYWHDIAACRIRREFVRAFCAQRVEVVLRAPLQKTEETTTPIITRDQRACRRLTRTQLLKKNERTVRSLETRFRLPYAAAKLALSIGIS